MSLKTLESAARTMAQSAIQNGYGSEKIGENTVRVHYDNEAKDYTYWYNNVKMEKSDFIAAMNR